MYFQARDRKTTSHNELSSLPRLSFAEYESAVGSAPCKHPFELKLLRDMVNTVLPQWRLELAEGFSLVLYGCGSKKAVIEKFRDMYCAASPTLTVNGYLPSVSVAKDVLAKIAAALIPGTKPNAPAMTHVSDIASYFQSKSRQHECFYLIIHNIDGAAIRSAKDQFVLSSLVSSCPPGSIRLIASVDNIHASLMWDRATADRYRWLWKDATTYERYDVETRYLPHVTVDGFSGADERSSVEGVEHVLGSLNQNARRMFSLLAESQIKAADTTASREGPRSKRARRDDNESEDDGERNPTTTVGLSTRALYSMCIEKFIVTNQDIFKQQLGEFRDHRLILSKRNAAGEEILYIPYANSVLGPLLNRIK
ncbi:Origin recognition complex subunit 2 [Irineochytrium annulatum]|nr:Origin recognition complex subunit 2 [Irineochytrium annulatum]